jgi:hypothetical protein
MGANELSLLVRSDIYIYVCVKINERLFSEILPKRFLLFEDEKVAVTDDVLSSFAVAEKLL